MNPIGNTSGKSCGNDLRLSENRQGMLADLRPFSPSPPRVAAVTHNEILQSSKRHLLAMHPATPDGSGAIDGRALLRQEDPSSYRRDMDAAVPPTGFVQEHPPVGESPGLARTTRQIGATFFSGALETSPGGESVDLLDRVVNRLLSDDYEAYDLEAPNLRALMADYEATILTIPDTGAASPTSLAQEHPPLGESPGPARATGQSDATSFGGALETPSSSENADLLDRMVNRLLSDEYEAYDPEAPIVRALMADYEATMLTTNATPPTSLAQGHPPVGESPGPYATPLRTEATLPGGALEASSSGASPDLLDFMVNRLFSDEYEAYDPEAPNVRALMADYEATMLPTDAAPSTWQIGTISFGEHGKRPAEPSADPDHVRKKKHTRGSYMLMTGEQRQAILHIFETEPERSNQSLVDEFGVSIATIKRLRKKFRESGDLKPGDCAKRVTGEQRQALLHIFETESERGNQSIADEFGVSISTIKLLRKKFEKTGDLKPGDHANRLTAEQRRVILHIFATEPERGNQSIVDEFGVGYSTIRVLKEKFSKTGNLKPGDSTNRLTEDQRRALSHVFETDPKRSSQSLANEFGVNPKTVQVLRKRFNETGNIKAGYTANRLTDDQRQAIMHIFETDPKRGNQSISVEFGVNVKTIQVLRKRFSKTGNIKAGDHANRLTADQRRTIMHIFETDPTRSSESLSDEFHVSLRTIHTLRRRFDKIGDLEPGDSTKRLTDDQRRAIMHIFETDPTRNTQSIVDEFGVAYSTIQVLKRQFGQTGDLIPGDRSNRLTADQRRAILHVFETDSKRSRLSLANEFGVSLSTIKLLRRQFDKTGNLKTGDHANRLTDDQRGALMHTFATRPERSNLRLADEFGVSPSTIKKLRRQFGITGNLKPGDKSKPLTADQRRAILHIFNTDPERSNQSLVDEFGVSLSTIIQLRKRFGKTGNITPGNRGNRLSADQRQAAWRIFETDPERSNQSLADEFGVSNKTIGLLRKQFGKT